MGKTLACLLTVAEKMSHLYIVWREILYFSQVFILASHLF